MSLIADPKDVMREPPSGRYVLITLIVAYLIYMLPADGVLMYVRVELH